MSVIGTARKAFKESSPKDYLGQCRHRRIFFTLESDEIKALQRFTYREEDAHRILHPGDYFQHLNWTGHGPAILSRGGRAIWSY